MQKPDLSSRLLKKLQRSDMFNMLSYVKQIFLSTREYLYLYYLIYSLLHLYFLNLFFNIITILSNIYNKLLLRIKLIICTRIHMIRLNFKYYTRMETFLKEIRYSKLL